MELLNCVAFVSTLSTLWVLSSSDLQLCKHGQETTHISKLNMDSSPISGTTGMCSCKIQLIHDAKLSLFPEVNIPGCSTVMTLSDRSFLFKCINGKVENNLPFNREMMAWDELWLFVKSTVDSEAIVGNIHIKITPTGSTFTIVCFDANQNESTTPIFETTQAISTTSSTTITSGITTTTIRTQTTTASTKSPCPEVAVSTSSQIPTAAIAGGIGGGLLLVIVIIGCVIFHRRYRIIRRKDSNQIPESRDHPTYCDLSNRENTEYEHIDHDKGPNENYQNVALDTSE